VSAPRSWVSVIASRNLAITARFQPLLTAPRPVRTDRWPPSWRTRIGRPRTGRRRPPSSAWLSGRPSAPRDSHMQHAGEQPLLDCLLQTQAPAYFSFRMTPTDETAHPRRRGPRSVSRAGRLDGNRPVAECASSNPGRATGQALPSGRTAQKGTIGSVKLRRSTTRIRMGPRSHGYSPRSMGTSPRQGLRRVRWST
jgi:hypothetical protein